MKKVRKTILSMACALCVLSILACNPTVTAGESNGNEQNQSSATVVKMSELRAYLESLEPNTPDTPYEICLSLPEVVNDCYLCGTYCNKYVSVSFINQEGITTFPYFLCAPDVVKLIIPDGIKNLGNYLGSYCGNLKTVIIPKSVEYIGDSPFRSCSINLTIYYEGTEDDFNSIEFKHELDKQDLIDCSTIHFNYTPEN